VAACSTPVPAINLQLTTTSAQACPSTDCSTIPVPCPTVMSIKIFDPNHPDRPFLTQCSPVNRDVTDDLCALNSVNLDSTPIPVEHLEVEVVVFAAASLARNLDNSFVCPDVAFSATGFPVEQSSLDITTPSPVVGGVGWYDPGDGRVDVNLGCTNLAAMQACTTKNKLDVTARVTNFATGTLVLQGTPDVKALSLGIGEPHSENGQATLDVDDVVPVGVVPDGQDGAPEVWGGSIVVPIDQYACLNVLESTAQATATVTCTTKAPLTDAVDLRGVWIPRKQLTAILNALGLTFPDTGITIGMVFDDNGLPASGQAVTAGKATIKYLSANDDGSGTYTVTERPTATSTIFVSTDAPFPTEFVVSQAGQPSLIQIGGGITGRVTVVLLGAHGNGA
jgi:hypothetical protein